MHFVRANLSLHDASTHLKGMMQEFVTDQLGVMSYSPDTLYKTIIEECRTKSKYTGTIDSFADLIKHKAITKNQVNGWLAQLKIVQAVPNWSDISGDLTYGAIEKAEIARQWNVYRTLALGAGNEAINRVRDRIRSEISSFKDPTLQLTQLIEKTFSKVWSFAEKMISDISKSRLKAMIIYEVMTHDPQGNVQETPQKSPASQP